MFSTCPMFSKWHNVLRISESLSLYFKRNFWQLILNGFWYKKKKKKKKFLERKDGRLIEKKEINMLVCSTFLEEIVIFQVRTLTVRVLCYMRVHTTSHSSSRYLPTSRRPLRANMAVCDTLWGWPFVHLEVPIRHARVNSEFKGHLTWMQNQILQWVICHCVQ